MTDENFEAFWLKYPKKLGKREARVRFVRDIQNQQDFNKLMTALENYKNYLAKEKKEFKYIMHGSTFMNNWEDFEVPVEEIIPKSDVDKLLESV